jgi:DNA-binding winged helix-turn-helix (wHTH) protein
MASSRCIFERFALDTAERQLWLGAAPVELNGRYLDALTLLVKEQGKLISKDRFLDEVWHGIPVTDEALTQCIRTIRKQLGDSAASPRFIETVPKHGYRFIAPVEWIGGVSASEASTVVSIESDISIAPISPGSLTTPTTSDFSTRFCWQQFFVLGGAGTVGGGIAGILGGLFFGLAGVSQASQTGMGTISVLLVFLVLSILLGLAGGAGVAFGIAIAGADFSPGRRWQWNIFGGAAGGMIVGAVVKMLGLDAFNLLLGQSPGDITGAIEGALLGAAVGCGFWFGSYAPEEVRLKHGIITAAFAGGIVGILIPLLGGHLMGGSLDLLARSFPNSRFRLDQIGAWFGESDFGPISQIVTGALEGAVFSACVAATMLLARSRFCAKTKGTGKI